jgi:hypothetical protein
MSHPRAVASGLLALALLLGSSGIAAARCGGRPGDAGDVIAAEQAIAAQCTCCGPAAAYARCVRAVITRSIRSKALASSCAAKVKRDAAAACPLGVTPTPCKVCNADADCGSNQFCECRAGTCSKTGGTCVAKPRVCPDIVAPVCGCDGTTFTNDCVRRGAGACKAHDGGCVSPTCQTDLDCNDGNFCTVDRCMNGQCEHGCICVGPGGGASCCGPGPLCVSTTTTTMPPACTSDAQCDDGDACSVDRCLNGACQHACICASPQGGLTCCPGPSALCVRPSCGLDSSGTCGGACPGASACEPLPVPADPTCRCVSSVGGPCGGNILSLPPVCAPGLVCEQSNPDVTGVCEAPGCIPFFMPGCTQTSDCCEPCTVLHRAPCAVCLQGECVGAP